MDKRSNASARLGLIVSMVIFGTIGLFRKYIPLPSGMIAFCRGLVGTLSLIIFMLMLRKKPDMSAVRKNLFLLLLSGAFIGANWILLFEAYNYTSVATATLCYYMAPMFVIIASPFLLKERMTLKQGLCVLASLVGAVLVSGILGGGSVDARGVLCGLGAAVLYASVVLINKRLASLAAYDKTVVQLASAAIVILPYTLIAENVSEGAFDARCILLLLLVGVVHTGVAYAVYFGSVGSLSAQTVAIFSYVDPAVAIILSAIVLKEHIGVAETVGAVLILGAALVSELSFKRGGRA